MEDFKERMCQEYVADSWTTSSSDVLADDWEIAND